MAHIHSEVMPPYLMYTVLVGVCTYYFVKYATIFLRFCVKYRKMVIAFNSFPGPERHWLSGKLRRLFRNHGDEKKESSEEWTRKYPKAVTVWTGPLRARLIVHHPDTCRQILKSTAPKTRPGIGAYEAMRPWLGDGLLISDGAKWFRNRRLLTAGFHFDVLKPYMKIYNKASNLFLDIICEKSGGSGSVEVFHNVSLCTLDIILKCAFSSDSDVQHQGEKQAYVNAVLRLSNLILLRITKLRYLPAIIYNHTTGGKEMKRLCKLVHDVSDQLVTSRRTILKHTENSGEKRYPDFLDILLLARDDDGNGLSDREIRDEVDTFLFEGHDTTASAISWALHTLAEHTEHQEKCYQEISHVFEGRDTDEIQWDDLNRLSYLTLCVKESMRLHTPVPSISRAVEEEFVLDGVTIPVGVNVEINIHSLHNNEAVWGTDYNIFRPERFNVENAKSMDAFQFLPFSAGPRNCIGQNFAMHEIKVVIAKTLHRYKLSVDSSIPAKHVPALVMRSEHGLYVFFNPRN